MRWYRSWLIDLAIRRHGLPPGHWQGWPSDRVPLIPSPRLRPVLFLSDDGVVSRRLGLGLHSEVLPVEIDGGQYVARPEQDDAQARTVSLWHAIRRRSTGDGLTTVK